MSGLTMTTIPTCRGWRWQVTLNGRCAGTGLCATRELALAHLGAWVRRYV